MSPPHLTIVAGPNGSGKSTLIAKLISNGTSLGRYINADDIARERRLVGDEGTLEAQALADQQREDCLRQGVDFSFETVMSHSSKVEFMRRAAESGYRVTLYFVATANPALNIGRVRDRVSKGGHDVPPDRIVARYHRTLTLLPAAIAAAHHAEIFDNSMPGLGERDGDRFSGLRHVASARNSDFGGLTFKFWEATPEWLIGALKFAGLGYEFQHVRPLGDSGSEAKFQRSIVGEVADPLDLDDRSAIETIRKVLMRQMG